MELQSCKFLSLRAQEVIKGSDRLRVEPGPEARNDPAL